jgi:hypothetical protein
MFSADKGPLAVPTAGAGDSHVGIPCTCGVIGGTPKPRFFSLTATGQQGSTNTCKGKYCMLFLPNNFRDQSIRIRLEHRRPACACHIATLEASRGGGRGAWLSA